MLQAHVLWVITTNLSQLIFRLSHHWYSISLEQGYQVLNNKDLGLPVIIKICLNFKNENFFLVQLFKPRDLSITNNSAGNIFFPNTFPNYFSTGSHWKRIHLFYLCIFEGINIIRKWMHLKNPLEIRVTDKNFRLIYTTLEKPMHAETGPSSD